MTFWESLINEKLEAARKGDAEEQYHVGWMYAEPGDEICNYNKALYWLRKSAKQNYAQADYFLAQMYHRGYGVPQDDGKAMLLYRKVMERNSDAKERVKILTCTEREKKRNTMSLQEVEEAAERGDAEALCELGWRYYIRWDVRLDTDKAMEYWKKAAELGHVEAKYLLYWVYQEGNNRLVFAKEAAQMCKEAAEQGHKAAQYHLGKVYEFGIGVSKDYKKALECYKKADEMKHPLAKEQIEHMEKLLKKMEKKAEADLKLMRLAEAGNAEKQRELGLKYQQSDGVTFADPKLSVYWLEKAANQGDVLAQFYLGGCYDDGYGVERNITKMMELYAAAAEGGVGEAGYRLGERYYYGLGIAKDYEKAARWYEVAVKGRHEKAMCQLARMYENGIGVEKNCTMAYNLYWKAVDEGYTRARVYLDLMKWD